MSGIYTIHKATTEMSYDLLKLLAKGSLMPLALIFRKLKKNYPELTKRQLYARINYYKRADKLGGDSKNGYILSKKGFAVLDALEMRELQQTKRWDGKWRIIAFDIPEEKRDARDSVRRLIKQLGCYQLQRSLWIHPLPCLSHFQKIQEAYGITNDIVLIETSYIDNRTQLVRHFRTLYPNL